MITPSKPYRKLWLFLRQLDAHLTIGWTALISGVSTGTQGRPTELAAKIRRQMHFCKHEFASRG